MACVTDRTVIVDAMGGPVAPSEIVLGAMRAQQNGQATVRLVGDAALLEEAIRQHGGSTSELECVHAPTIVGRRENAARALKLKRDTSLALTLATAGNPSHVAVTFGNRSALRRLIHSQYAPTGRLCPFVAVVQTHDDVATLLDVGPHVTTSARHLAEFACMGGVFHRLVNPNSPASVSLLSGEGEASNCTESVREAHRLMNTYIAQYRGLASGRDWIERPTGIAVVTGELGAFLLDLSRARPPARTRDSHDAPILSWAALKNAFSSTRVQVPAPIASSSVVLGADRLVVHGHDVASDIDVQRVVIEAAELASLNFVRRTNDALESIGNESLRTTMEVPARTGS